MIQVKSYADWSIQLEKYANGDDTVLEVIQSAVFELDAGTTIRFYDKIQQTYTKRKKSIFDRFNREVTISSMKTNSDFILVFRNLNNSLLHLKAFIEIKAIPDDLKKVLTDDYDDYIEELKSRFSKIFRNNIQVLSSVKSLGVKPQILNLESNNTLLEPSRSGTRKIIF